MIAANDIDTYEKLMAFVLDHVSHEDRKKIEDRARKDAQVGLFKPPHPEGEGDSYSSGLACGMRNVVYIDAYVKRVKRMARMKRMFPTTLLKEGIDAWYARPPNVS